MSGLIEKNKAKRELRLVQLDKLLARKKELSQEEYVAFLHEARDNYLLQLVSLSVRGAAKGSGACINVVDRIDSILNAIAGGNKSASGLVVVWHESRDSDDTIEIPDAKVLSATND